MQWIRTKDAVERYNVSKQYIHKLIRKEKIISRKVGHRLDINKSSADAFFSFKDFNPDPPKKPTNIIPKRSTGKRGPDTSLEDEDLEQKILNINLPDNLTTVNQVDIALKKTKIEAQKLKNEYEKGRLIERDKVESLFFEISRRVRDSLESIPPRLSALLVDRTKHEIEQMLIEEIKLTLTNLSLEI